MKGPPWLEGIITGNGINLGDERRHVKDTQLCLTNPDVLRIVTERMLQQMAQDPHARPHTFSQMEVAAAYGHAVEKFVKAMELVAPKTL